MTYTRKLTYLLLLLSSFIFLGCGGSTTPTEDTSTTSIVDIATDSNGDILAADTTTYENVIEDAGTVTDENTTVDSDTADTTTYENVTEDAGTVTDENTTVDSDTADETTIADTFPDAVMHDTTFNSEHFSGSQNCAQCHDGIVDESNGNDVSIVSAWQSSMMANAAIDPLWRAKVASEVKRNPQHKELIEKKCSRCHTPMATVEAGFAGDTVALSGDGFFNPQNPHYDEAMNGVSCTLCHQIENTPELGTADGFSGGFTIADNALSARKTYGPFTNPKTNPMINNVQFTPEYSPHINDSKLCASCHNLDTPVIDPQGNISSNTFPEQAVYTEWENSDFNATQNCQSCHMPKTEGSVVISTRGGNLQARSPLLQHQFVGANTYMLDIIKNNRVTLGATADVDSFDRTINNTRSLLLAAADVDITQTSFTGGKLLFTVQVNNHSGHKFPTSFPSRRAWLHVTVHNVENQTVFESGAFTTDGKIVGVDDETDHAYETHHTKINDNSDVQIYETVMADMDDNLTYTLMHASQYLKDNRILPKGFRSDAPATIQPYGEAVKDSDFIGGSDNVEYEVDGLSSSTYSITVTLKYQTLSYAFAKDLYNDVDLTEVALMKALDEKATIRSESISSDTSSITIP